MSQHIPRKRFGQNFLQDPRVIDSIVHAIGPDSESSLVEIGPGLGALTRPLIARVSPVHVVEIDRDIVDRLKQNFTTEQIIIHEGDALKFDFATINGPLKIVGNLPYNISTPLLFHLAEFSDRVMDMHFMLQKEVVDRMIASPSCADYGRLSVMLQYLFDMELLFVVPPDAFWPPPKVDSAVVRMIPAKGRCGVAMQEPLFDQVVMQAFAQRRKTLRNNFKSLLELGDFEALSIDPGCRAETLSVEQYVAIANYLAGKDA